MTADLAYCSHMILYIKQCASAEALQINSAWEAHQDQLLDEHAADMQILLSQSQGGSV